jgi:hypothetical protein
MFAGSYAEACVSRRPLAAILKTSGAGDLEQAAPAVAWLAARCPGRTRRATLDRAHQQTFGFLLVRWSAIERVAAALLRSYRLTARQVLALAGTT